MGRESLLGRAYGYCLQHPQLLLPQGRTAVFVLRGSILRILGLFANLGLQGFLLYRIIAGGHLFDYLSGLLLAVPVLTVLFGWALVTNAVGLWKLAELGFRDIIGLWRKKSPKVDVEAVPL